MIAISKVYCLTHGNAITCRK